MPPVSCLLCTQDMQDMRVVEALTLTSCLAFSVLPSTFLASRKKVTSVLGSG